MEYLLSQVGLMSICAIALYIMWRVDQYLYERNTRNPALKSDTENEDWED